LAHDHWSRSFRIALCAVVLGGCSYPTSEAMYEKGQCAAAGPSFHVASSVPADGATGVELKAALTVTFDDFPDPASVAYPQVTLRSGSNSFDYDAHVDLVNKALVLVPKSQLTPMTQYVIELATGAGAGGSLQSLACGELAGAGASDPSVQIAFTTGTTAGSGPMPPPAHSYATDVGPILSGPMNAKNCVNVTCHAVVTVMGATYPAQYGLDLSSEAMVMQSAVGVTSSEKPMMARIKPGDPANSYLVRKVLGTPDIQPVRMPIGQVLDQATLQTLSDWIVEGAP
jgi:hypothetical protein